MGDFQGKVAIVTGSSSGMGEAIAHRFADEGAGVVVNSSRSVSLGEAVAASLPDAVYVQADISRESEAKRLVSVALDRWGRIDVVVNNAGLGSLHPHSDLDGLTDDIWQQTMGVNLMGPWYLIRAAAPALRADGGGAVVNVTSLAGTVPTEDLSSIPYHLSKSALNHLTILLANALGPEVRVNALAPGGIETPIWRENRDLLRRSVSSNTILARPGQPDDIADVCLFLARPGYVTGQLLTVDGGMGVMIRQRLADEGQVV
jgi:ketoreductase RED2